MVRGFWVHFVAGSPAGHFLACILLVFPISSWLSPNILVFCMCKSDMDIPKREGGAISILCYSENQITSNVSDSQIISLTGNHSAIHISSNTGNQPNAGYAGLIAAAKEGLWPDLPVDVRLRPE